MSERQPISADIAGAIPESSETAEIPVVSYAENGDTCLNVQKLAELGDQGVIYSSEGRLFWAVCPDGNKLSIYMVKQQSKLKRVASRLPGLRRTSPNFPSGFLDALTAYGKINLGFHGNQSSEQ